MAPIPEAMPCFCICQRKDQKKTSEQSKKEQTWKCSFLPFITFQIWSCDLIHCVISIKTILCLLSDLQIQAYYNADNVTTDMTFLCFQFL